MAKHFVAVETAPGLPDTGKVFAVDPSAASGIALPSFKIVTVLPRIGNITGEGYFVTTSKTAFAWDGRVFQPVVPSAILTYPNDAAVYADNTQPPGSYGASADTGHLFIMSQTGWRMVGSKTYADIANANADTNVSDGALGWLTAEQVMIIRVAGAWQRIVDTPRMTVSAALPTTPITGDMHYDPANKKLQIYDGSVWAWAYYGAIVGEIKQSILTEQQFTTAVGAIEAPKWRLCDGRSCAGTSFATIAGLNTVPDLRGAFLRGAGQNANASWTGPALRAYQEDSTKRPTTAFTGGTGNAGNHSHSYTYQWPSQKAPHGGSARVAWEGSLDHTETTTTNGDHTHTVTINGGGDAETRPKNYGVNFFIKVNA